jgi:uncharacterized DUF497 family protein
MIFEWDERKRLSNLKKHGVDFADARCVFEDTQIVNFENISKDFGEHRFISIGYYEKWSCVTVIIHTKREEKMRIISFRKANKAERGIYHGNSTIHNFTT